MAARRIAASGAIDAVSETSWGQGAPGADRDPWPLRMIPYPIMRADDAPPFSVVVPWRDTDEYRARAWERTQERLERFRPNEIITADSGHDKFNRGASLNLGVRDASYDTLLLLDADTLLYNSSLGDILREAQDGRLHWPYSWYVHLAADDSIIEEHGNAVGGALVITREAYDSIDGHDEGFVGWGFEDRHFAHKAESRIGTTRHLGVIQCLWHPPVWEIDSPDFRANEDRYARTTR